MSGRGSKKALLKRKNWNYAFKIRIESVKKVYQQEKYYK